MHPILRSVFLLSALLLAACAGSPTPTPTPTAEPTPEPFESDAFGGLSLTIPMPMPGTLVPPLRGDPRFADPLPFDEISFTQVGGAANVQMTLVLAADGTYTRNDETGTIPLEQVDAIARRLRAIDFFNLEGIFTGPVRADTLYYSLTVDGPDGSRTIDTQDDLTPPELLELFRLLSEIGQ